MADLKLSALAVAVLTDAAEMYLNASGSRKATLENLRNFFLGAATREAVVAASTGNGTLATDFENADVLDGVTLATGDRILLKDQTAGAENGLYTVEVTGAPTRATDFDVDAEAIRGAAFMVIGGTINANTIWMHTTTGAITLGTTALVFTQIGGVGKQTLWISASEMQPSVTAGCAALATLETVAGQPDQQVLGFDTATEEHAQFSLGLPKAWDLGTITFQPVWTHQGGQTGGLDGVAWGLQAISIANAAFAQAYGTEIIVTDDQVTADNVYTTSESAAVTIAGTLANKQVQFFQVSRVVADGLDDLDIDAQLVGIWLHFTTNKPADD